MKRIIILYGFICICSLLYAIDYVAITEIMYDTPFKNEVLGFSYNAGEYIELYNAHEDEANISGWSLETVQPRQIFRIPEGVVLAPHSTLLIAYKSFDCDLTDMTDYGYCIEDFCTFYDIEDTGNFEILIQDSIILPDDTTILLLKDDTGITRDSTIFGIQFPESPQYAPNIIEIIPKADCLPSCLKMVFSIQRKRINFNLDGTTIPNYIDWGGWNLVVNAKELPNNSVGVITPNFSGCNIFSESTETSSSKLATVNYVQEATPLVKMTNIDTIQIDNDKIIAQRTYYDAMFRPTLTILYNNTPNRNNLVTLQEYDVYARPCKEWLPIAVDITNLNSSVFANRATQFYNDSRPFSERTYSTTTWENGVTNNELTGVQQVGADMGTHKTNLHSRGNTGNEVRLFKVQPNGDLQCCGYYPDRMLHVKQTTDEDGKTQLVFTNLQEQVVMEKVDNAATYYVYNDLNQLCYVLPPLAANQITDGTYSDTTDVLKKYAYVYKYDERGNQIYKQLPGCEPVLMVYDKSNLLVMSQTGNQRARGTFWTVCKYDDLRRLVYTAEVNTATNDHQELMNDFSGWHVVESFSTGSQTNAMSNTGYSRNFYHNASTRLLTVNYYDNYDFMTFVGDNQREYLEFLAFDDNTTYANAKGLLTGSRTYSLHDKRQYSETVYYYDYRGREIQRRSTNHLDGYDVLSTKYDFTNNITDTWSSQTTRYGTSITEHYQYAYDHANRPTETMYQFNDESPIVLQSYHYDELGRVRSRHLHGGIDSVTFAYNIRDQIIQIKSSGYEQKYYYNQQCPIANDLVRKVYNGNISATTWTYGNTTNGYIYYYDNMNRLKSTYSILNNGFGDYPYSETFSYDAHGNIKALARWDNQDVMDYMYFTYNGNQLTKIDDDYESYSYSAKQYHNNNTSNNDFSYDANGNMLYDKDRGIAAIRYNLLNLPDTIQFANGNQIVHRYDAAGNRLTTNYYTRKVTTSVPLGNTLKGTNNTTNYHITRDAYHNNIVYHADNSDQFGIKFVHNSEGFIRYYGPSEHYHFYHIKDLLGNIRETYIHPEAGYKECMERTQYYPSGLPWVERYSNSEGAHPWKYNGKEFVEMHGLDEYDSKARWYYPAICRTTTMDPLAEKYYSTSPYAWCGNNPMRFVDPDGKKIVVGTWYGRMFAKLGFNNFEAKVTNQLETLKGLDLGINEMITSLEETPTNFYIEYENNKNNHYNPANNTIKYDPNDYIRRDGEIRPPEAALVHELGHAENDKNGTSIKYNKHIADGKEGTPREQAIEQEKRDRNEVNSIYYENIVREKEGYPQRGYNYSAGD